MRLIGWAALSCLLNLSCSTTPPQTFDKNYFYKRNLNIEVNGKSFVGTGVVSIAPGYKMRFKTPSGFNLDFLIIRSCSGEEVRYGEDDNVPFDFTPRPSMDLKRACPISIQGVSKDHAKRAYGWIDFEMPRYELNAQVFCNWKQSGAHGVSACETAAGLLTRIEFAEPVTLEPADQTLPTCHMERRTASAFEFSVPRGNCQFIFFGQTKAHRFSTYGYEKVLSEDL